MHVPSIPVKYSVGDFRSSIFFSFPVFLTRFLEFFANKNDCFLLFYICSHDQTIIFPLVHVQAGTRAIAYHTPASWDWN